MNVSGLSFFTPEKERHYEDENHLGNDMFIGFVLCSTVVAYAHARWASSRSWPEEKATVVRSISPVKRRLIEPFIHNIVSWWFSFPT